MYVMDQKMFNKILKSHDMIILHLIIFNISRRLCLRMLNGRIHFSFYSITIKILLTQVYYGRITGGEGCWAAWLVGT